MSEALAPPPLLPDGEDSACVQKAKTTLGDTLSICDVPIEPHSRREETSGARNRIKRTLRVAVATAVVAPGINEGFRAVAVAAAYGATSSALTAAAVTGGATFALEAGGAIAAAPLVASDTGSRFAGQTQRAIIGAKRLATKVIPTPWRPTFEGDKPLSTASKVLITFLGGSVVGQALDHIEDPARTPEQHRVAGLKSAGWLAGSVALMAAGVVEAFENIVQDHPNVGSGVVGVAVIAEGARHKVKAMRRPRRVKDINTEQWRDTDTKYQYEYGLITDPEALRKAAKIEQDVWTEMHYGDLVEEGYAPHIEHSRTFAAFKNGQCIGLNRMFRAWQHENGACNLPPFFELVFDDSQYKDSLAVMSEAGLLEELGTVAVLKEARRTGVNTRLWRLAYRDAVLRGVKHWGVIMEPPRVKAINRQHGFTFRQVGPAQEYQGGMCAPHVLDLAEVSRTMQRRRPLGHWWFVRGPLRHK